MKALDSHCEEWIRTEMLCLETRNNSDSINIIASQVII
jgi:hypothetical protein